MFGNIVTSIQRWFSNAKLKLNADTIEYMIIRKCKIVKLGLLRLPENGNYTEQVEVRDCYINCQLICNDRLTLFVPIHFIISVKYGQFEIKLKHQS